MDRVAQQRPVRPQPWGASQSTDRVIANTAARQHGIVGRDQLLAAGITNGQIRWRVGSGRLFTVFAGAYAVGVPAARIEAIRMAALIVTAPSLLSHRDAAEIHELWEPIPGPVHVTVAHGRSIRRPGILVHRTRHLHRNERRLIGSLRVTTPARTLVDLAATSTEGQLTRAFDEAMRLGKASRDEIAAACERSAGRPGTGHLTRLIAGPALAFDRTRSRPEARFLRFCANQGLPIPLVNVPLLGYEVDFLWPGARLVVELDSSHHDSPSAKASDAARDARLAVAGYRVLRLRPQRLNVAPKALADQIRGLIGRADGG